MADRAAGALWIIVMRVFQGVGGAFLFANSSAILTDAFPADERGKAMGINGVAAVSGPFLGLVLGGVLAPVDWRLVFLVSVPFGLFGTVWAYLRLQDNGVRVPRQDRLAGQRHLRGRADRPADRDRLLAAYPTAATRRAGPTRGYWGRVRRRGHAGPVRAGSRPGRRSRCSGLNLFRIRAFTPGNMAGLLGALGRGGLQFMLIIWLQGIWLPQHGYSFSQTPLWAGIYMIPLTLGFLIIGPISGSCPTATGPGAWPRPDWR